MRFAIVNNKLCEAAPKLSALCPGCAQPVIAKCGTQKIHHWAHKKNKNCDNWWEPETQWHREWKNHFPKEWQEKFLLDTSSGEKHIADVQTEQGFIIEFQHSKIEIGEKLSREKFYKNMLWVVDGTRLKNDFPKFLKGTKKFREVYLHSEVKKDIFYLDHPEDYFPINWVNSTVPVIFDFLGNQQLPSVEDEKKHLYCLFHHRIRRSAVIAKIKRKTFVESIKNGQWHNRAMAFLEDLLNEDQIFQKSLPPQNQIINRVPISKKITRQSPFYYDRGVLKKRRRL